MNISKRSGEREYQEVPKYPAITRDISLIVDSGIKIDEVQGQIEEVAGGLLLDSDLFDIYEGENLPENKKSLAFHLIFQSKTRTLKDEEVDKILKDLIMALEKTGYDVRKG